VQKAFCIIGIPENGEPIAKASASLLPLIKAAKSARISGELDGKEVRTVFVLSSEGVGPVCKYRCASRAGACQGQRKEVIHGRQSCRDDG
jgi:hypothetical protein